MKKKFIICCFVVTNFLFVTCDTTEPPIDDISPGKSDYIWSIDSVDYGNLPSTIQLESIGGSSASDA